MSLAGLEAPEVVEAHQASIADPTGWFLIKYEEGSRDRVQLLQAGTGGVNEARRGVEAYGEKSPLYGLVPFRRRRVLIKYVPDGTSRVFQVRLKVQFQSVLDALAPYDNVFEFSQASELTESALTAATMLAPSNGSVSSHSSLRKKRLNNISEHDHQHHSRADTTESAALALTINDKEEIASFPRPPSSVKWDAEPELAAHYASGGGSASAWTSRPRTREETDELPASALRAKALMAKRKETAYLGPASQSTTPTSASFPRSRPATAEPAKRDRAPSPLNPANDLHQPTPTMGLEESLPATPADTLPSTTEGFEKITEEYLAETTPHEARPDVRHQLRHESQQPRPEPDAEPPAAKAEENPTLHPSLTAELLGQSREPSGADQKTISQWNDDVALYSSIVRPKKKKLGPRPHVESSVRPGTADLPEKSVPIRPVSNLPPSVKITNSRAPMAPMARPMSQQSSKSMPIRTYHSPTHNTTLPPLPPPPGYRTSVYRPESRAYLPRPGSMTNEPLSNATPEKLRLMKALQLRKRNMLLSQRASQLTQERSDVAYNTPPLPTATGQDTELPSAKSGSEDDNAERPELSRQASDTESPSTTTNPSEERSTNASSIASHEETPLDRHHSLSSDTSSSVTPKCQASDVKKTAPAGKTQLEHTTSPIIHVEEPSPQIEEHQETAKEETTAAAPDPVVPGPATTDDEPATQPEPKEQTSRDDDTQPENSAQAREEASKATSRMPARPLLADISPDREHGARIVAPLFSPSITHSEISDSDSLMDALQNAVVEEAMSMPVARSPATPVMHTQAPRDQKRSVSYSSPQQQTEAFKAPGYFDKDRSPGGRSVSSTAALPQWSRQSAEPVPLTNKSSLGTGISKRIKALEVVSSRQSSPPQDPSPARRPVFSLFPKHSPDASHHQQYSTWNNAKSPPTKLSHSSPSTERSISGQQQPSWRQRHEAGGVLGPTSKGETVSVTARIVRDYPSEGVAGQSTDALDFMHQSPLIVEHDKPTGHEGSRAGRASFSSIVSPMQHQHQQQQGVVSPSDSTTSKWAFGRSRKGSSRRASDVSSSAEEGPRSRTGRLMKRLTHLAGGRASTRDLPGLGELEPPRVIEEDEGESCVSTPESLQHVVDIGDVNVQFPESLLWKRRFIRIDDQGSVIFSPPDNESNARSVSRRYHLADCRTPTLPDLEREQMANSIVLDFKDGSSIHCACESKEARQQVLQMLVDAHSAYHQLFGTL